MSTGGAGGRPLARLDGEQHHTDLRLKKMSGALDGCLAYFAR